MSELWRDERKLLDLDGKGNRDAKTVLDHRRFWRGFIHNKIGNYEEQRWKAVMDKKPKLRTYVLFKTKLKLENYLSISNIKGRKLMASLRSGTNMLEIETGRWKRVAKEQRLCEQCELKQPEDEKHFVVECSRYQNVRGKFFDQVSTISNGKWNLRLMTNENLFILLMAGTRDKFETKILQAFQCFIVKCFRLRKDSSLSSGVVNSDRKWC